jgi:hypothetical protein
MEILQPIVAILLTAGFAYAAARWGVDTNLAANSTREGRAVRWALPPEDS